MAKADEKEKEKQVVDHGRGRKDSKKKRTSGSVCVFSFIILKS